jgi:hypothetical protein
VAKVRVVVDNGALTELLMKNPYIRDAMMATANDVKGAAEATAQDAQNGAGGTLHGYAEAGFSVSWQARGKRPRLIITSDADPEMALRVHFYTQKRDGIAHLRKALRDGATR